MAMLSAISGNTLLLLILSLVQQQGGFVNAYCLSTIDHNTNTFFCNHPTTLLDANPVCWCTFVQ